MKSKNWIFYIILFFLLFGCKKNNDSFMVERLNQININYLEVINKYNPLLINQFPKKINNLPVKLSYKNNSSEPFNYIYLFDFNVEKKVVDSITSSTQRNGGILIDANFSTKSIVLNTNQLKKINLRINNNEMLVPYFSDENSENKEDIIKKEDMYSLTTKDGLVDKFKTYIIDYNYDDKINHKYSKGVSIYSEKKIVIYWTIYW
ncbi:hypothetical protein KYG33_19315 [Chryseobacterium sp. D764]|jgi:hypothetical protein|uniref:hypothetical protein n=1 Tax=unclassified Chryseobacterium TaxID=2593645 RepID=UPI000987A6BE|nr:MULTISPECIES: hypothetical protein [unclassified Chryseobacterium]QXU48892.1 hypothetical protein KYG33_19315 [Chryseobacterium sp. D764]